MRKFLSIFFVLCFFTVGTAPVFALSEKQTDDILKPGIVHVLRTFSGTAQVPIVEYDAGANQFRIVSEEVLTANYNERDVATGFVVNPDGYIAADPFIARSNAIKDILANKYLGQVLDIDLPNDPKLKESLLLQGKNTIARNITLIENVEDMLVIGPLFPDGIQAEVLNRESVDNTFDTPAILRIDMEDLPALSIEHESISGDFYYDYINLSTEIFTENSYITKKNSIDMPSVAISDASFGGPIILRDNLSITGMLVFDRVLNRQGILLNTKILDELESVHIENTAGAYQAYMQEGFDYMEGRSCRHAVESFKTAKESTSLTVSNYVDPYIAQCNNLIAEGRSKDTFSGFIRSIFDNVVVLFIFGILGTILVVYWFTQITKQIVNKRVEEKIEEEKERELREE